MQSNADQRILFLINPLSGGMRGKAILHALQEVARQSPTSIEVAELNFLSSTDQIEYSKSFEIVVLGGGDGTISTLAPMLDGTPSKIGILPLGTGNDLARELGLMGQIPWRQPAQLPAFYRAAGCRAISRFKIEFGPNFESQMSFLNYVSFGYDAKVAAYFAELRKYPSWRYLRGVWGNRAGYAAMSLRCLHHYLPSKARIKISHDEVTHTPRNIKSLIFANIRSMMGIGYSNKHSSPFDEQIECIEVLGLHNYLSMILDHRFGPIRPRMVGSHTEWRIENIPHNAYMQVDGEPVASLPGNVFRIRLAGKLPVLVGQQASVS